MTTFNESDLQRLRIAHDEINNFGSFLKDRLITWCIITGKNVPLLRSLGAPRPLDTQTHPETGVNAFHVRECLGGDRFGVDYREHYLPADFALGGAEAEKDLREKVEEVKRLQAYMA